MRNLVFFLVMSSTYVYGSSCISNVVNSGLWNDNSSWICSSNNSINDCVDTIIVSANDEILINSTVDIESCGPVYILVYGVIKFQNGKKLKLADGSVLELFNEAMLIPGSGGGNSNYLQIGDEIEWNAADGTVTGPMTFGGSQSLPVNLISFSVNCLNGIKTLSWTTLSEINNDYFIIEGSYDGLIFHHLDILFGSGLSIEEKHYQYQVNNSSFNYFRLKQVDNDGTENVIGEVIYEHCNEIDKINVRLERKKLHLYFSGMHFGDMEIRVYDLNGVEVLNETILIENIEEWIINDEFFGPYYFVKLVYGDIEEVHKILVETP